MNVRLTYLVGLVTLCVLLAACAPAAAPTPPPPSTTAPPPTTAPVAATKAPTSAPAIPTAAPTTAAKAQPIRIGISLPLTGVRTEGGTAARQGYEIWAKLQNEAGGLLGRPIELTVLDNASKADTAVSDYEKLITVDKVDLVVGPYSSALVLPTSAIAQKYNYIFIEPAGGASEIFERCFGGLFFAQPAPGARGGDVLVEILKSLPADQQPKTVAWPQQDDPYMKSWIGETRPVLEKMGYKTVYAETFPVDTKDFSTIALGLRNANADLLVAGVTVQPSVDLIRALEEVGYQPKIFYSNNAPSFPEYGTALKSGAEATIGAISWHRTFPTLDNTKFVAMYEQLYKKTEIPEDAANSFTVGQILAQAIKATNSIDNATLIKYVHENTFDTVVGKLKFDKCGRPLGYFHGFQWQKGKIEIIWPKDESTASLIAKPKW